MIPPFPMLQSYSLGGRADRQDNMLIEGDNLQVLAALPPESIDLVYTDPPYNSGKKLRYNDCWKRSNPRQAEEVYVTEEEAGHHTPWINFMASRIRLLKRLLKPSGIIAVSIGKQELFRLGLLLDDFFGEGNCLGIINWQTRYSPSNDTKHVSQTTDYVLIYTKGETAPRPRASFFPDSVADLWGKDGLCFDLARLQIGDVPMVPFPLSWYQEPFVLGCQSWPHAQSGHTQDAMRLLNAIMGGHHRFATPKPLKLVKKIIQLWCPPHAVVLDAFAGSGTTGHAILELNAQVHSNRSFILIEHGNPATADHFARTLTAERLRRAVTGQWDAGKYPPLSGGFTFYSTLEG